MQANQERTNAIANAKVQHWGDDRCLSLSELPGFLVSYIKVGAEVIGVTDDGALILCMKLADDEE